MSISQQYKKWMHSNLFINLIEKMSMVNRPYHNIQHLNNCFDILYTHPKLKELNTPILRWAIWYHDFVYSTDNPGYRVNEELSAHRAALDLSIIGVSPKDIDAVTEIILATQHHLPTENEVSNAMCDLDLAILGSSPSAYSLYRAAIRREWVHIANKEFNKGRIAFLQQALARPKLFSILTDFEDQARINIQYELDTI